jgi:2-polyprenyl-3-methyl-5-hydroxy-6-metoxy-1,4-benzoquinol methylase
MDVVERLTLEAAQADTMIASEHRQRYEFAGVLCSGQRVLDLCCGSGYGSAILAGRAQEVVGVDNDAATIETARVTVGRELTSVGFELADAVAFLRTDIASRFDAVVCFEGLEHLEDLDHALALLREHAERGVRIVASVPNGKLFAEQNPYHVTEFGYDEALRAFEPFPATSMVPQFLAEGSLISPSGATETEVTVSVDDRNEPEYANHFIFCVGFSEEEVGQAHHGRIQLNTAPVFNRWAEDLKQGAWALRRENARLARARLGKGGSAAASALQRLADRDTQIAALQQRCREAEERAGELAAALAATAPGEAVPEDVPQRRAMLAEPLASAEALPLTPASGDDFNSTEMRHRRAAEVLIPWIEQTVELRGKTVLEYGCGNAAVSRAFAQRAKRIIGVDIDPGWIELGNEEIRKHGVDNVELECHPPETIRDAVAARRGEVDVFLLYAVLEHLTVAERLAVLRLAREVVKPDGAIVVCESPNRLVYFDHHTAQMPFFHLLPAELALEYYPHSSREDFKAALEAATRNGSDAAHETLARWGRGVSFHEFEVVFGDQLGQHVLASNYDPILFGERPIHADEVILARYLERWRPDLAPVWSRYWLDLILSPRPLAKRPPFLRPWTAETVQSKDVAWTGWENLYLKGPDSTLWVTLPHPTSRLVVGSVTQDGSWVTLYLTPEGSNQSLPVAHKAAAGRAAFASLALGQPAQRVAIEASGECHVVFVGYED